MPYLCAVVCCLLLSGALYTLGVSLHSGAWRRSASCVLFEHVIAIGDDDAGCIAGHVDPVKYQQIPLIHGL